MKPNPDWVSAPQQIGGIVSRKMLETFLDDFLKRHSRFSFEIERVDSDLWILKARELLPSEDN